MSSVTVQPMELGMASGAKSRLSSCLPKGCHRSRSMRKPDIMPRQNELPHCAALFLLIFCTVFAVPQQAPATPQTNQQAQAANSATPQAQSGIHREGTDNILV